MEKTLRVIIIQDRSNVNAEQDCAAIIHQLDRLTYKINIEKVHTKREFEKALICDPWNIVVSEYVEQGFTTREALSLVKEICPELPFILVSSGIGEEAVVEVMKAGAEDVVIKSRLGRLIPVIKRIIREHEIKEKEAKAHRLANEAFAAKEQMLAIVSHDIKNPLSAIQLEAQMLLKVAERHGQSLLADEVIIQAGRIAKTTDRLKTLISDLLDQNKNSEGLSALHKSNVDPIKLLHEVLDSSRSLVQQKEINLKTNLPAHPIMLPMDKNKIFQVLTNLLGNAIKFTPVGGTIEVSIEDRDDECICCFTDNGPGLKDSDLDHVFEKYWTGGVHGCSGTGLGLFICKTIVEAHGGQINVANSNEMGARFSFSVPKPSVSMEKAILEKAFQDQRKRIYVIDDDEDLREVIGWALSKEGYAVQSYRDPREALARLKEGKQTPQLIVMDFHMDGMKGGEFLIHKDAILLPDVKKCPVVMISASPEEAEESVGKHLYDQIIPKPLDLEGLVNNIKRYVQ